MSGRVTILGAGFMRSCLALELARRGMSVTLFDLEAAPLTGASRWNEGKKHLGYLNGPALAVTALAREAAAQPGAGRYVIVDNGKYSTAPLMARDLAREIAGTGW